MLEEQEILAARPAKNAVSWFEPYAYMVEPELTAAAVVEDVATIFLTNRECPFRCVMCDLWKNTTDETPPVGAIPTQIEFALARLPEVTHVKLYNSGNFFDSRAIPVADHQAIADRVRSCQTVIVENHPKLCGDVCAQFRQRVAGRLEVALGLETAHPAVLAQLNKQMTVEDFQSASRFLVDCDIDVRTFILLQPPFMNSVESVDWCVRSVETAFAAGSACCAIIPTRGGNGAMETLAAERRFQPPSLDQLEEALDRSLELRGGRVFVDLWDVHRLANCDLCRDQRIERLRRANLQQRQLPRVDCQCRK
jgi:hypothetical protein